MFFGNFCWCSLMSLSFGNICKWSSFMCRYFPGHAILIITFQTCQLCAWCLDWEDHVFTEFVQICTHKTQLQVKATSSIGCLRKNIWWFKNTVLSYFKKKDKHIFLKLIKCICSISRLSYPLPDSAQISWLWCLWGSCPLVDRWPKFVVGGHFSISLLLNFHFSS